jgi:predicted O-methyltransferase YrrM
MALIPDFYRDPYEGQMTPEERKVLYNLVLTYKPSNIFEVGTWKGGGSTYFLSSALHELGAGKLHTVEIFPEFYNHAINLYNTDLAMLRGFIDFHLGDSTEEFSKVFSNPDIKADFVLLDGKEYSYQTLVEYNFFKSKMPLGSVLAFHDWKTEKMGIIKNLIKVGEDWKVLEYLPEGPTGFISFEKLQ